jgi:hypothetical protein
MRWRRTTTTVSVVLLLIALVTLAPVPVAAQGPAATPAGSTVVDELGPGFVPGGSGWHDAPGGYASHHYWTESSRDRSAPVGIWRATLAEAGLYRVEAMMPPRHATTRAAGYRIGTADGVVLRTLDQARAGSGWASLGTYRLDAHAAVRLSARTADPERARR